MRVIFLLAVLVGFTLSAAGAQTPSIYKCRAPAGSVVYQDAPCTRGQTPLPFTDQASVAAPEAAPDAASDDLDTGKDFGGPTKVANPLDDPKFRQQLAASAATQPSADEGSALRNRYTEPIAQTIAGLLFASVLVGLVALTTRKRPPNGDPDGRGSPTESTAPH